MALTALTGCGASDDNHAGVYHESGNTINRIDQNELYNANGVKNNGKEMTNFGYVRHQKNPVPGRANVYSNLPAMDREKVADLISKICTTIPNVNDVGTLVTDEEVLVAYKTDSKDRNLTADQVKRAALSVVPRFFHVYVSDDPDMMKQIERFGTLDSDSRNVDQIITSTIQQMIKSPQGYKVSDGENENGEMEGGLNPEYERKARENQDFLKNPSTGNDGENQRDTGIQQKREQGKDLLRKGTQ
ncbi:YhcN/YlaJ family sporulation lipoprotein [Bacillus sp. REN16]|nr:YhcN/YlaJ family sporulation lipoprotein [Bacillus sp. REN16]MCC3355769.1 YhcN/YlaJ family sporulation lipoprotein [Bacillus sp. REN16]